VANRPSLRNISTIESSLLIPLTSASAPPFPLTANVAVIILSRTIRSLNRLKAHTLEELAVRREAAAILAGLRIEIQKETFWAGSRT
jgi:hypothetical protein